MPVQNDKRFCEECNKPVPADEVLFDKDGEAITHIGCGKAGSAETGGEKAEQSFREALTAALYRVYPKHTISVGHVAVEMREWLANFPRTSQNQTVSSGVEGAHEGTTADKSGEPEKLNNAQKAGWRSANEAPDADMGCPNSLAESSLSSPPDKEKKKE